MLITGAQTLGPSSVAFASQYQGAESEVGQPGSVFIWVVSITDGGFTCYTTMLVPLINLGLGAAFK